MSLILVTFKYLMQSGNDWKPQYENLVGWGTFLGLRQKKNIEYQLLTF